MECELQHGCFPYSIVHKGERRKSKRCQNGKIPDTASKDIDWISKSYQSETESNSLEHFRVDGMVIGETRGYFETFFPIDSSKRKRRVHKRTHWNDQTKEKDRTKDIECDMIIQQDSEGDCILFISIICERRSLMLALVNLLSSPKHLSVTNHLFQNALHLATVIGDHVMVRRLLIGGIQIEQKDRHGNTALHIACERGSIKIVNALLTPIRYEETMINQYKAPFRRIPQNLELRNNEGLTCLHVAAIKKDLGLVKLLLSKNADVNARFMKDGKTILHLFCELGNRQFVEFLLSRNDLNINAQTYSGTMASRIASCRGHTLIASLLLHAGANNTPCDDLERDISDSSSDSD